MYQLNPIIAITDRECKQRTSIASLREGERRKYNQEYFAQHYWREDLPNLIGNRGLSYDDPSHQRRFAFLSKTLIEGRSAQRVIDVGCGPGHLVEMALADGVQSFGVDLSEAACKAFNDRTGGRWRDRFTVTPMNRMPFETAHFDLCLCLDVLEHVIVFDIFDSVRELCRVASDKIICTINLDNPYDFHPTILSRKTWVALFESYGAVYYDEAGTEEMSAMICREYPEYDAFVFKKVSE